jgi:hypothetical protein
LGEGGGILQYFVRFRNDFGAAAEILEFAQVALNPFELAGKALGMHAEVGEGLGLAFEGGGDGEGVLDFFEGGDEGGFAVDAEGQEIGFERRDTVESPGGFGEGLDEVASTGPAARFSGRWSVGHWPDEWKLSRT